MSAPATRDPWREPASLLPLRWGGYRERLVIGLWLVSTSAVAIAGSNTNTLWLLGIATAAQLIGWCILPAAGWRRVVVVGPATFAAWLLLSGPQWLIVTLIPYLGWLLVRHRPARSYPTAIFVLATALVLRQLYPDYGEMLLALGIQAAALVASAWLAWVVARR